MGCTSLASVTIGSGSSNYYYSSLSISTDAFQGCTSLTSVTLNSLNFNNYNGGSSSASVCTLFPYVSFAAVIIPSSVNYIGNGVFKDCTSLTSVTIPKSVSSLGAQAFKGCTSLTKVSIMNLGIYASYDSFEGCSSLSCIYFNPVYSKGSSRYWHYGISSIGGLNSCCQPGTVIQEHTCSRTCQAPLEYYDSNSNSCRMCAYLTASTDSNDIYNTDDIYECVYQHFGLNQGGTVTILFLLVLVFVSCLAFIRDENNNFDWTLIAGNIIILTTVLTHQYSTTITILRILVLRIVILRIVILRILVLL